MRIFTHIALGLLAFVASTACDTRDPDTAGESPLPNSLADTSAHVAQREIPAYGAPEGTEGVRAIYARGQVLYVPVYSHIFHRSDDRTFDLTTTLSIRNTSSTASLTIDAVDYFDSEGTILKSYVERPRRIGPLASTFVVIEERDRTGGVGANFIVTWRTAGQATPPLVEAVMISTHGGQGVSFTSPSRVLQEW